MSEHIDVRHSVPCIRPPSLAFSAVPANDTASAIGRCGHRIYARYSLVVGEGVKVIDTMRIAELGKDAFGVRPLGPLGLLTGLSPHRCDSCRRQREWRRSIVCPVCRKTIVNGDLVSAIDVDNLVDDIVKRDLRPFVVFTKNKKQMVVCEPCGVCYFNVSPNLNTRWVSDDILSPPDPSELIWKD